MNYSMTCSCGHVMTTEAETREEAVAKMKGMMTQEELDKHMAEKHAGQPAMSLAESHAGIEQNLKEA